MLGFSYEEIMNKCLNVIGVLMGLLLFTCCGKETPRQSEARYSSESHAALAEIDSLMWRRADSALTLLLEFAVSPEADSLNVFEGHYCQLLISELLYKNYAAQTNRTELLQAVAYFDSLVREAPPLQRGAGGLKNPQSPEHNDNITFLNARAHYINGAGFYEQGDVVSACAEYLKALEVIEEKLDKKSPKGKDAVFMFYTYNRLLSLFSTQFMMDPAIFCCEQALACCQNEPTLSKEIPNTYYHMGKQYDKKGEKDIARYYYGMAIEGLSDINNPVYRDAMSTKALCDYQVGLGVDSSLTTIRQMLSHANSEKEKLTRFLTIGVIFTIEQSIDSALYYLEPIYESKDNISLQTQAAEYLLVNYDNTENKEKAEGCMRFLSDHKKSEGETKAFVSKIETMYKDYINQKQEKEAEEAREMAVRKAMSIIIPVAIGAVLVIIVSAKLRNKKLLKEQREEADRALGEAEQEHGKELRLWQAEADEILEETKKKYEGELRQLRIETDQQLEEIERKHQQWMAEAKERQEEELRVQRDLSEKEIEKTKKRHEEELETERLAYQTEQEALRQSLQQQEAKIHALENTLSLQRIEAELQREEFLKESVCGKINDSIRNLHITAREGSKKIVTLTEEDALALKEAVLRHYPNFEAVLLSKNPKLGTDDLLLCYLYLLGLDERQIAALMCKTYSAIKKRAKALRDSMTLEEPLSDYILRFSTF